MTETKNNPIMRKIIFFPLIILLSVLPYKIWSQTDTLKKDITRSAIFYIGIGGGPNTRGGNFELSFTVAGSGYWGGSLNLKSGFVKMDKVPADYGGQFGRLPPLNEFTALSFNLVKKLTTSGKLVRFGFEAGPTFFKYYQVDLVIDPNYGFPGVYKYDKVHAMKHTLGASLAAKVEFPFSRFFGCGVGLFTIINKIQSVVGFNACINLGKVRR